ncbi:flagellar motor switch protein FliN [Rhodoblastus sp.]|uniref:flagellar motor switch protein FliN n=1 Tax=Rhodoblastus sp. TaxID=1962975 RepID=UPI002621DC32|nr:flagellar motor switch protein FliN [Rhodoblastus sp.]
MAEAEDMQQTAAPPAEIGEDGPDVASRKHDAILRIPVTVQVVLGSARMPVAHLMKLGRGAVVALDQRVGEPVNVVVNGRIVARGEVVVVDEDNSRFGVSLTEIVGSADADAFV